jgi:hypothetical protein
MNAHAKPVAARTYLDPAKEAQAVAALKESLRQMGEADDDTLLADSIEGETSFFEIVDVVLDRMTDAEVNIEGVEVVAKALSGRKARYEQRLKSDRATLEQAMTIAGLAKIERPTATLSLSNRPPSLTVTEESEIPAEFWKAGDPTLDRKKLAQALKDRAAALAVIPGDPEAKAAAIAALPPEIPGATLSNGAPSLTVRRA